MRILIRCSFVAALSLLQAPAIAAAAPQQPPAQQPQQPFEPTVGQAGKDVVWVPTPLELVEKMLDMAAVTPSDVVMDLGSGDGRNIIAAAKRGARAINMEVWDRKLFEWINPGKNRRVGWDNWVQGMVDAVDVSSARPNVRPNFVSGVEMARPYGFDNVADAVKSTSSGFDFMMKHGIFPRLNEWRREPGSNLVANHPQPTIPLEFYLELMANYYATWKRYSLPIAPHNSVHPETRIMGRGHGTYDDIILLNEVADYEERVDDALKNMA